MLYVAAQIWFELLLAFSAGAATMWWWQRSRGASVAETATESQAFESSSPRLEVRPEVLPGPADDHRPPRARPIEPTLPPSLVAMAEQAGTTPQRPTPSGPGPTATTSKPKPPAAQDDLTLIRGVGPVLQRRLHALGVFSLDEIASWTAEDVDRVQSHLTGFPNRIHRDRWVDQAKELVTERS